MTNRLPTEDDLVKRREAFRQHVHRMYHTFDTDISKIRKTQHHEEEEEEEEDTSTGKAKPQNATYGAANLSLKHLLAAIESKKEELSITQNELSTLLSDVRKNRSKWASEDKIGQEELYEAAEKVVLQLRATTEHSTAFLNKVNKRDAPNYFNIIKKPMDLNTVLKKLKGFQYKSKKEFVDDLMLIWSNCLKYNADPSHFLRVHAKAMQAKTLQLIPLIPDITVRDRAEVEAEEARLAKEEAESDDDDKRGGRAKGAGTGKHAGIKGRKRKLQEEETPAGPGPRASPFPKLDSVEPASTPHTAATPAPSMANLNPVTTTNDNPKEEEVEDTKYEPEVAEFPDIESLLYQELYGERALAFCMQRAELFKENQLQLDRPALIRDPAAMAKLEESEFEVFKSDEVRRETNRERVLFNRTGFFQQLDDDDDVLVEYDIGAGIPGTLWKVSPRNKDEGLDSTASIENLGDSGYVQRRGLSPYMLSNLQEMQNIRKICFKIGVIRQMQQQAYMHSSPLAPYNPADIVEPDLDPESRLPNRDTLDEEASCAALRRNVAKIAMHSGFEETEVMALDALTEIAGDYLQKLGRSLKMWMESHEPSKQNLSFEDILLNVLEDHGVESISSLEFYIKNDIERHHNKLVDQKKKLALFVADLLRPNGNELNDTEFKDGSEQFLTGDFSEEIGDDFFGFKELGLDRELGLESMSVPLHLLQSRFSISNMQSTVSKVGEHIPTVPEYAVIDRNVAEQQIAPIKAFLLKRLELNAATSYSAGQEGPDGVVTSGTLTLLEGDALPAKLRNSRPKVPPTGKLPGVKKKQPAKVFHRPPPVVSPPPEDTNNEEPENSRRMAASKTVPGASKGVRLTNGSRQNKILDEDGDGGALDMDLFGNGDSASSQPEFGFVLPG